VKEEFLKLIDKENWNGKSLFFSFQPDPIRFLTFTISFSTFPQMRDFCFASTNSIPIYPAWRQTGDR